MVAMGNAAPRVLTELSRLPPGVGGWLRRIRWTEWAEADAVVVVDDTAIPAADRRRGLDHRRFPAENDPIADLDAEGLVRLAKLAADEADAVIPAIPQLPPGALRAGQLEGVIPRRPVEGRADVDLDVVIGVPGARAGKCTVRLPEAVSLPPLGI
jgi:hypothetical protein